MGLTILTIFFLILPVLLAAVLKKGVEDTAPFVVFSTILIMFLFGLIRNINMGVTAVTFIFSVLLAFCLRKICTDKKAAIEWHKLITPGLVVYAAMFFFFMCFTGARMVSQSDEFSHWAIVLKNMWEYNNFGNDIGTSTAFYDYPPAQSLLLYFFTKKAGFFSEVKLYFAAGVLLAALYPICVKSINIKKANIWLPLAVAFISFPAFVRAPYPFSLYVDVRMAYMFAWLILYWVLSQHDLFFYINYTMGLSVLTLTKNTGIALVAFAVIFAFVHRFFKNRKADIKPLLLIALPLIFNALWSAYVKTVTPGDRVWDTSGINIASFVELFNGTAPQYRYVAVKKFARAFLIIGNTFMPYGFGVLVALAGPLLLSKFTDDEKTKKVLKTNALCMPVFMLVYAAAMLVLYLFSFDEYAASNIASYDRYMSIVFLGVFLSILSQAVIFITHKKIKLPDILCPLVCMGLIGFQLVFGRNRYIFHPLASRQETREIMDGYRHMYMVEEYVEKNSQICFLSNDSADGLHQRAFGYILTPHAYVDEALTGRMYDIIGYENGTLPDEQGKWYNTVKEKGFDYLYLHMCSDEFAEYYGKYFKNPDKIAEKCLYFFDGEKFELVATLEHDI